MIFSRASFLAKAIKKTNRLSQLDYQDYFKLQRIRPQLSSYLTLSYL